MTDALAESLVDLHVAVPTVDVKNITFSQFLMYSKRISLNRLYSKLDAAVAGRTAMITGDSFKKHVDFITERIREIEGGKIEESKGAVEQEEIRKQVAKRKPDTGDDIEWDAG